MNKTNACWKVEAKDGSSRGVLVLACWRRSRRINSERQKVPELACGREGGLKMPVNSSISELDRLGMRRVFLVVVASGVLTGLWLLFATSTAFTSRFLPTSPLVTQEDITFTNPPPFASENLPPLFPTPPHPSKPPPEHPRTSKPLPKTTIAPPFEIVNPNLPYINRALVNMTRAPDVFLDEPVEAKAEDGTPLKIILYWNDAYSNKHFGMGYGRAPFLLAGCRVNTCLATGDRRRYPMQQVDAILWHFRANDKSLPKERSPHTRYVFWMMESASYLYGRLEPYSGVFNWTFTYKRNSDLYNPYDRVYRRRHPLPPPPTPRNYAEGKTKMAAWFVSNCYTKSGREKLVPVLKRWLTIDIYGKCGQLRCERSMQEECHAMLSHDYKFYLSFENSLCQDYVTEKFFNMLRLDVVPVVWGKGNYTAIAPPHSFIDAFSFPSARSLAAYLLYLDKNDTAYNEYFSWKRFYHQSHDWAKKSVAFCDLCEKLHSNEPPKTYDLKKWFVDDSHCKTYNDADIENYIDTET